MLTMNEEKKYETIKALVDHPNANKLRAAVELGCTLRTINRMILRYKRYGKTGFIHGNRGRKPVSTIPDAIRSAVVMLYLNKYYDANFTHFTELLSKHENITLSVSTVAHILEKEFILSPKVTRAKKKRVKKLLETQKESAKTAREVCQIHNNLIAIEDAHSRRPRHAYFGEQEQADATPYEWVNGKIWHLHLAIDDATGIVTGGWFDTQETLHAYYHVLKQILTTYGIPAKIFTDNRTVFNYKRKNSPSLDEDTQTQFGYTCKQLGIRLNTSSVPQAKGRIERLNQTLQSRLPVELRLAGIHDIDSANEFLKSYLKEFNAKFALLPNSTKSVFVEQPSDEQINLTLAVLTGRTIDHGHSIKFKRHYYRLLNSQGEQVHYAAGTKVLVIQAFDGSLYCSVNDTDVYALEAIPDHAAYSPEFDPEPAPPKPKKPNIPDMNHPWKKASYMRYLRSRSYHNNETLKELL